MPVCLTSPRNPSHADISPGGDGDLGEISDLRSWGTGEGRRPGGVEPVYDEAVLLSGSWRMYVHGCMHSRNRDDGHDSVRRCARLNHRRTGCEGDHA